MGFTMWGHRKAIEGGFGVMKYDHDLSIDDRIARNDAMVGCMVVGRKQHTIEDTTPPVTKSCLQVTPYQEMRRIEHGLMWIWDTKPN